MDNKELKSLFTSYWHYLPLKTACKLNLFDNIINGVNTVEALAKKLTADKRALSFLLKALVELETLDKEESNYQLTAKGVLLTEQHPKSVKYACILWGEEHLTAWQQLEYTILEGEPAFEAVYNEPFFEYLKTSTSSNEIYHKAMSEYARDDYEKITSIIDFSTHKAVLDIGGGLGALLDAIHKALLNIKLFLLETPNVIDLLPKEKEYINAIAGDFFDTIPTVADAFVMSRVLHDWDNKNASKILANAYKALPQDGCLYIIENMKEQLEDGAHLLNLNMQLMCNSYERTTEEYRQLLENIGFQIQSIKKLNSLQSILIVKKK